MDKMFGYAEAFSDDTNGDGKMDEYDQWGIVQIYNIWYNNFGPANGEYVFSKNEDGTYVMDAHQNERLISIWSKLKNFEASGSYVYDISQNNNQRFADSIKSVYDISMKFMEAGSSLFSSNMLISVDLLRGMEDDFGIIPFPKYEETEPGSEYQAYISGFSAYGIPITSDDPERTGHIIDTLSYVFYNKVTPAYIDLAVTSKNVRDTDSAEMLTMLSSNIYYDVAIGYWFDQVGTTVYDNFWNPGDKFVSSFKTKEKLAQRIVDQYSADFTEAAAEYEASRG